ncbi:MULTISPECIES: PhzF family phenazine biosynthesis protein [unclassified Arthrobacter]|uniref:PhzF family phenazine biosynthesis protein n=1 Tax=unclassified Arthrobacter TaxID=235627 RepID=UPI001D84A0F8|nr:PhzF family phenazine biosynthesis isomerase [Arthrobacter sp. Bi26]CAH0284239.1 putative isomerase YddE [Arthrobacter sp. Bi26]
MNQTPDVLRYAAFATSPGGGNPAGVVLDATRLDAAQMQVIAADVGYAETVFITGAAIDGDSRRNRVRYFSPIAEVPFWGHATIALAVALSRLHGAGTFTFDTSVGLVSIESAGQGATLTASFTSVEPRVAEFPAGVLDTLLGLLGVGRDELHPAYPPLLAFAGNWHPILVFADRRTFDSFGFDPDPMRTLMDAQNWAGTVTTLCEIGAGEFDSRNLFPAGAITEDPATGSAAAAFGGYLRLLSLVEPPSRVVVLQGSHVGRPSRLTINIPPLGGIAVRGEAVEIA